LPMILIVDDDPHFRRTLRLALLAQGHEVAVTSSRAEALDSILRQAPDLVLLDWRMPGMDGLETCRAIHTRSKVPVVVVSSDRSLTQDEIGDAGASSFVVKPFSIGELAAHIDAALRP
jgi:DNA-binding response OmpR family regulator